MFILLCSREGRIIENIVKNNFATAFNTLQRDESSYVELF